MVHTMLLVSACFWFFLDKSNKSSLIFVNFNVDIAGLFRVILVIEWGGGIWNLAWLFYDREASFTGHWLV